MRLSGITRIRQNCLLPRCAPLKALYTAFPSAGETSRWRTGGESWDYSEEMMSHVIHSDRRDADQVFHC
jgi:hypothetical protein